MSEYYGNELDDRYFNVFSSDSSSHCSETAPTETTSFNGNFELGPAAVFDNGPIELQPVSTVDPKATQYSGSGATESLGAVGGWTPFSPPAGQNRLSVEDNGSSPTQLPFELPPDWQYTTPTDAEPYHAGSWAMQEEMRAASQTAAEGPSAVAEMGRLHFPSTALPQRLVTTVLDEVEIRRLQVARGSLPTPPSSEGSLSPLKIPIERSAPAPKVPSVKPFICNICGKDFTREESLVRHLNDIHAGESVPSVSYRCEICGQEYARFDKMQRHVRDRHLSQYALKPWTEKPGPSQSVKRSRAPNGTRSPRKKAR